MKKYGIVAAMIAAVVLILSGCADKNKVDVPSVTGIDTWYFYNEAMGESEVLRLGEDGSFSHNCECGEPIGNADVFDRYYYDLETGNLHIYNDYDEESMDMKVRKMTEYELVIESEGRIKTFIPEIINGYMSYFGEERHLAGYNGYVTVMDIQAGKVNCAPFNYDGDVEYPAQAFSDYDLAEDAVFYDMQVSTRVDDSGEVNKLHYKEMSKAEVEKMLEDTSANGFLWFGEGYTVEKIVFYGQSIVME